MNNDRDRVDRIRQEWKQALPDLDTSPMEVTGRILSVAARIEASAETALDGTGLGVGEFAVLITLRRVGKTGGLSATEITEATMVTAGATTQRLDRLEKLGLLERRPDPTDRRALRVHLTRKGARLSERAMTAVAEAERVLIAPLSSTEQDGLAQVLHILTNALEQDSSEV